MSSSYSRRRFLRSSALATGGVVAGAVLPVVWPRRASGAQAAGAGPAILVPAAGAWNEPDLAALAQRAIEAAKSAGATYADVRLTFREHIDHQDMYAPVAVFRVRGAGVRVLADGQWGFMASAAWTADEMARLARGAVAQARTHASIGTRQAVELGKIPVCTGEWRTPIKYDPFEISHGERADFFKNLMAIASRYIDCKESGVKYACFRERKVFASSEGSAWTQTTYRTHGGFSIKVAAKPSQGFPEGAAHSDLMVQAGCGWEHVLDSGIADAIPAIFEEARGNRPWDKADPGLYDIVFGAQPMTQILFETVARATELDRAMGYEANAAGTSYLSDPLAMLGTQQMGTEHITVVADRSTPGGLGTVKWDDESVVPDEFTILKNGVLTDFQTTREQSAWLAPYYEKAGRPIKSHGCAGAESGLGITTQANPNIRLMPGEGTSTYAEMVAATEKGLAVSYIDPGGVYMDHQQLNGVIYAPYVRRITKGKLGPLLTPAAISFRTPEFWKHVTALGGPASTVWFPSIYHKGQPDQEMQTSVGAVPACVSNVAFYDPYRR